MFDLRRFINDCKAALDAHDPTAAVRALVEAAIADPAALQAALPPSDMDEAMVYADEQLMVVHIQLSPNVHFPPHNHHMPVVVGLYRGVETNFAYRLDLQGNPAVHDSMQFMAPAVYTVPTDGIHSVANHGSARSAALHVYLGDLVNQQRTIWDPASFEQHPYSDHMYFALTVPLDQGQPFVRPETPDAHGTHGCASGVMDKS